MRYANIVVVAHGTEKSIKKLYDAFKNRFEESKTDYDGKSASFESNSNSFVYDDIDLADSLVEFSKEYGLRVMYRAFEDKNNTSVETDEFFVEKGNVTKFQSKWYPKNNAKRFLKKNDYNDFYEWMLDMPSYNELPEIA